MPHLFNQRKSLSVIIQIIWLFCGICGFTLDYEITDTPFIWWQPGSGGSLPDGRFEQIVILETPPMFIIEEPEVWLRLTVQRGFAMPGGEGGALWQKCSWSSSDPWTLIILSDEYAVADVFARAESKGHSYYAQISFILYGQADAAGQKIFEEGPDWPEFRVRSNAEFYWPQTGHEFSVNYNGAAGSMLEVYNNNGELAAAVQGSADGFTYTPENDPALNRLGSTAAKPVIFVVPAAEGGSASYTQMVHRSRFGGLNMQAGLVVLGVSFSFSGLAVWLKRRVRT